ncbi:MAG: nicotinate (nicotinamide) nucleotide adenylyltransferase [Odoribacter sp.]|nr:nicotinate (nicotinamide) nucleotide adenylyltransferase [Odoribacter sp.]
MTESKKEVIGILGGSFNPVHVGHMILASYLAQWGYVDKVWLTLSPRNPLKDATTLIPDTKRLTMLNIALKGAELIDVCDLELTLPTPSYTIRTLDTLRDMYPGKQFKLIVGSDNWAIFNRWREGQRILDEYGVIVYPRPGYPIGDTHIDGMAVAQAPLLDISSTMIRSAVSRGRDMEYFLPAGVYKYIIDHKLYR